MALLPALGLIVLLWPRQWKWESNAAASSVETKTDSQNLDAIFSQIEKDLADSKEVDKFGNRLTTLEVLAKRYQKQATAGNHAAQLKLGAMYLEGLGVYTDYGQAFRWFAKARGREQPLAQLALGLFCLKCREDSGRDERFREHAIRALGEIGPGAEAAVEILKQEMFSGSRINYVAAEALGGIGPKGLPPLIEAIRDGDIRLRCWAIRALMKAGDAAKPAIPLLTDALKDPDKEVRQDADNVLKMLRSKEQDK